MDIIITKKIDCSLVCTHTLMTYIQSLIFLQSGRMVEVQHLCQARMEFVSRLGHGDLYYNPSPSALFSS